MQASKHFIFMEALVRRILEDDAEHQLIHEEFYRLQAGLSGEEKLKNTLSDYSFRSEHATLFNFECINSRGFSHQIDALLFTPNFIIVFEVKQISGTLSYKASMNEFSRITENGVAENFINPFDQVFRHKLFIEQILSNVQIDIPVLQLVVVANYRAILDPSLESMPILHLSGLPHYLEKLYTHYPATSINPHTLFSIINQHAQTLPARRTIEYSRIKHGVLCPACQYEHVMVYKHGSWRCESCQLKSKNALFSALHDYRILVSPRITNQAFRHFLGIANKHAATRWLTKLDLASYGEKKGRYYVIPEKIKEHVFETGKRGWI